MTVNLSMEKERTRTNASIFLDTIEASEYLGLRPNTLAKMRVYGTGPDYRKHGRYVRYHIDELNQWSLSHRHSSTSDE